jgi:hypothetical protein
MVTGVTADDVRTTGPPLEWEAPTVTLLNLTTKEVRLEKERMRKQWARDAALVAKARAGEMRGPKHRRTPITTKLAPIGHRKLVNTLRGRLVNTYSWADHKCIEMILDAYDGGAFDDLMTIAQDHADGLYAAD